MALVVSAPAGTSTARDEQPRLHEGMALTLEFALPDGGPLLKLSARVVWLNPSAGSSERWRVALGVAFAGLSASEHTALERFVVDYRPGVAVALASSRELALARRVLEPSFQVHACDDAHALHQALGRGDVQVVTVFGSSEEEAFRLLDPLQALPGDALAVGAPGETVTPRVIYCGVGDPVRLLRLEQEGRLSQTLPGPVSEAALFLAVSRACEDFLLRSELKRTLLELERTRGAANEPRQRAHRPPAPRELVFESAAMREAMELLRTVAPHKAHVLLTGETGTGKELMARALHELSDRAAGPFVAIDCGALTETLLESELFGHVQGAFTGANATRPGLFQLAEGGTLFLDEIENTTPSLQAKLLRVLDTGELRPVGGNRTVRVDVRLVAATNRDLAVDAAAGRFRPDLFYRLNAFPIWLPPLRERREDVLSLTSHFLGRFARELGHPPAQLSDAARQLVERYHWPGNVRELRNAIERAVLLCGPRRVIEPRMLPPALWTAEASAAPLESSASLDERVAAFERELIARALARNEKVVRRAALELGASPVTLARKARRYGLL